jgi:tetratricopeptide (TPR) repeat protein
MHLKARVILGLPLIFTGLVYAQTGIRPPRAARPAADASSRGSVRGKVLLPDGSPLTEAVKVTLQVLRGDQNIAYTDQQGQFEINNLAPGQYTLEIDADRQRRFEVATERILVQRDAPTIVIIYLKEKTTGAGQASAAVGKTISVAALAQNVPSAAKREFERASRLAGEGKAGEAIVALRRAIAIYPDYLMARNDLGAQLLEQGQFGEAAEELRAALKIDPKAFNPQLNLGIVFVRQNNFPEALAVLEKALSLDPASAAAHLYAGMAAAGLDEADRAERELKAAYDLGGAPYAIALFHLGQLYMTKGEREMALKSFESYLREAPNAANAAQVQKLIGMLR